MASALTDRFWSKVDRSGDCWIWTAYKTVDGYGRVRHDGRLWSSHRLAYEDARGPIPDGLEIDHLCRTRACVNPAHLEPVTHAENVRRGDSPQATRDRCAAVTHCPQGHEYTTDNTAYKRGRHPKRICKQCNRERVQRWRDQQRSTA